jgi:NADPH-dependent curcumin reductase CurA
MREALSKSLTLPGYINYERTVGAAVADGRIRYRENITDGLKNAPAALLQGHNFGEALVRIVPPA